VIDAAYTISSATISFEMDLLLYISRFSFFLVRFVYAMLAFAFLSFALLRTFVRYPYLDNSFL
jgi:hypothetical protein